MKKYFKVAVREQEKKNIGSLGFGIWVCAFVMPFQAIRILERKLTKCLDFSTYNSYDFKILFLLFY